MLAAIDPLIAAATPTHVLLLIGTNDVSWWIVEPASAVADRVDVLIGRMLAPGRRIVVGTIPPSAPLATAAEPDRPNVVPPNATPRSALVDAYNAALRSRVEARRLAGQNVRLADLAKVLTLSDLYDGVHPKEAAGPKVARVWFDAMFTP